MTWVIVGAGPIGTALAIEGAKRDLGVPLFIEGVARKEIARLLRSGFTHQPVVCSTRWATPLLVISAQPPRLIQER